MTIDRDALFRRALIPLCMLLIQSAAWGLNGTETGQGEQTSEGAKVASRNAATGKQVDGRPTVAAGSEYVIGPEDVLDINVWKEPDITRTLPVRPDGKISLPLVGEIEASGLTASQLQQIIAQKLKDYIANPQVNVIVQEVKSRTFNIVGKVAKPGSFDLAKPTAVLDAIALAGGFQDFAKVSKIYVLRRMPDGTQKMLPFNYKLVIKGKQLDENVELQSGDTVVVP